MTAVIISSALIGAISARPLLRWAQRKEAFLSKLDNQCADKLLLPAVLMMALLIFILYTSAYALIVFVMVLIFASIAAAAASAIRSRRPGDLSTLMVSAERVKAKGRNTRAVFFHSLLFAMIFLMLATEGLIATANVGRFLYRNPDLHAFISGKRAAPMLIDLIQRGDYGAGLAASSLIEVGETEALIEMGPPAVPALISAFGWIDEPDQWAYSSCCGYSHQRLVIKEGSARAEAIRALVRIGEPAIAELIDALKGGWLDITYSAEEALVQIGSPAIPHLKNRLPLNNSDAFRVRVVRILRRIGDPATAPDLIAALSDAHYAVRVEAALGLGQMKEQSAAPVLIHLLRDHSLTMRCAAARALGDIGDRKAVPALMAMLSDGYEEMREETSKAIEKIGDTLPALTEGLKKGDVEARRQAAFWLRQFRDAQAAPALIDALADADAQVRQGAAERLGELGQLKDRSSVVPLIAALSDVNSDVKTQAAQSLGLLGDPMAVDALVRELKRSDDSSWRYFAEALIKIGDISIAPQVIARIRKMAKSERHWPNLRNALTGFGIRAAPFMLAALDDRDAEVRHLAASVLAQVGDAEAIPPMERAERKYHQQEFCPFCKALQDLKTR